MLPDAVCKALCTSPRGTHPRGTFLCNRDEVSYYTKKTDACMLRTHHLPCHILIVILYVIYLHFAKTIFSRVRVGIFASKYLRILLLLTVSQVILDSGYHPRNQLIKFELLTQSITRLTPQSAVAPPVRMGLTNLLVGKQ